MIRSLECVQLDPVTVVERNHHPVLAARIPGYTPETLNELLGQRRIFEYRANAACILSMEETIPSLKEQGGGSKNGVKPNWIG